MQKERSAGAVVFRVSRGKPVYLLLHYEEGHWDFPKGRIEEGESVDEAARREIGEETGIGDVLFVPGFHEKIGYFLSREGKKVSKTVDFLLAETNEDKVALSSEHTDFEWLPFGKAAEKLTYANAKELLGKADSFLKSKK